MGWVRSTRNELARLKRRVGGAALAIKQEDGSTYTIARDEAYGVLLDHLSDSLVADYRYEPRPAPPPVLKAVASAQNRERALSQLLGHYGHLLAVDPESLVERGELVPRDLTPGYEPIER
jgi:hypothetical protein